jgi:uncharacterized protein YciI
MRMLFAVVRTRGRAWDAAKPMRSQQQWSEHARFMDRLAADGFVVLGGPLGSGDEDFLLAIQATDERDVISTLQRDPWSQSGMLEVKSMHPWTILLESTKR